MNKRSIILALLILVLVGNINVYAVGYIDFFSSGLGYYITPSSAFEGFESAIDDDLNTYYVNTLTYKYLVFPEPVNLHSIMIKFKNGYFKLFDETGKVIYQKMSGAELTVNDVIDKKVSKFLFAGYSASYGEGRIYELDFVIDEVNTLGSLNLVYESSITKINLTWDIVPGAEGYKVYLNETEIANLSADIGSYTIEGLNSDTDYFVQVYAYANGFYPSVFNKIIRTKNYFSAYPSSDINVGIHSVDLVWNDVEFAVGYELKLGVNGEIVKVTNNYYTFENLEAETTYQVYIRTEFADKYSDWNIIEFTTLPDLEVPPPQPDYLKVLEVGSDYIKVEVSSTVNTDYYNWYLNNELVGSSNVVNYTFSNLSPGVYSISVRAVNEFGESRYPRGTLVTIEDVKTGIIGASSSFSSSGNPLVQTITWDSKGTNSDVKILVDGVEVGIFSGGVAELDFESLGLVEGIHEVEIVPLDGTDSYTFKVNLDSTMNEDLDLIVAKINDAKNVMKKAGFYLVTLILSNAILFFVALWLFNKYKLAMSTNTAEQLEANPDGNLVMDMSTSKDTSRKYLDKETIKRAKLQESNYFENKELNKVVKTSNVRGNNKEFNNKKENNKKQSFFEYVKQNWKQGLAPMSLRKGGYRGNRYYGYNRYYKSNFMKYQNLKYQKKIKELEKRILELEKNNRR